MSDLDIKDYLILWTPAHKPDEPISTAITYRRMDNEAHPEDLRFSTGGCWMHDGTWSDKDKQENLKGEYINIVIRDRVCPYAAFEVFSQFKHFTDGIAEDTPYNFNLRRKEWKHD